MTGLLVLAAGNSSRMGRPKQLLMYNGKTLLRHAAETGIATGLTPVVVVLGAESEKCVDALRGMEVRTAVNPDWQRGMGTSIRAGMAELEKDAEPMDGVLIMLLDQPAISSARLVALVESRQAKDLIVASTYNDVTGVPAWFSRELFEELRQLDGPRGAQTIIRAHTNNVRSFDMPEARDDIDTPEDYERLFRETDASR